MEGDKHEVTDDKLVEHLANMRSATGEVLSNDPSSVSLWRPRRAMTLMMQEKRSSPLYGRVAIDHQ